MQSLQELITRGRFAFSDAPARLDIFMHVNGKRSTKEIASKVKRHVNNVRRRLTIGILRRHRLVAIVSSLDYRTEPVHNKARVRR